MAVFGGRGGFAAVSSQFLNKHHKSNFHTKAHCCNSFFGLVPALVLNITLHYPYSPLPPLFILHKDLYEAGMSNKERQIIILSPDSRHKSWRNVHHTWGTSILEKTAGGRNKSAGFSIQLLRTNLLKNT